MLKIIRQGRRWVTAIFVLAIGGVFVFFIGLGAPLQRGAGTIVQVGSESFGLREFSRVRARRESLFQEQLGSDFDARAMSDTLDDVAIRALIEQAILSQQADAIGLTVSRSEIKRSILTIASFRGEDGRFDPEAFDNWANYEYGNQRNFIREQRASLLMGKLLRILHQAARVSEGEARQAVVQRLEEVQIAFVVFGPETPATDREATNGEAPDGEAADGTAPDGEAAEAEKFEPDPADLAAFLASRSAEAQLLYGERASVYDTPEQVRASHILMKLPPDASDEQAEEIRAGAQEILERIRAGEDFAELAEEHSEDPGSKAQGGDLGWFGRGQMVKDFDEAAFSREPGELGELVESSYGYHVLRVEERREARVRSFEEVQEELATEILAGEARLAARREGVERLAEVIRRDVSLEDAARAEDRALQRSGRLRRRPDGFVPGLGAAQDLMTAAFSMESGETSDRIFEVGDKLVMVQVLSRHEPEAAVVAAQIEPERERLEARKRQAYVATWINQRRAALAASGDLTINLDLVNGAF